MDNRKYIVSWLALAVSIIALLFGGLLSGLWGGFVQRPQVSAAIALIEYREVDAPSVIDIPADLMEATRRSQIFPTLEAREEIGRLQEILDSEANKFMAAASSEITLAVGQLTPDASDAEAKSVYDQVSAETKAVLGSLSVSQCARDKAAAGQLDITKDMIRDSLTRGNLSQSGTDALAGLQAECMLEILNRLARLEAGTGVEAAEYRQALAENSLLLATLAKDMTQLGNRVAALIDASRTENRSVEWTVIVTFYNSGGATTSLLPIGALAIQRQSKGNVTIDLSSRDLKSGIVLPPGETVSVEFVSDALGIDKSRALIAAFNGEERDCIAVFNQSDGRWVLSSRSNFARSASERQREALERFSQDPKNVQL